MNMFVVTGHSRAGIAAVWDLCLEAGLAARHGAGGALERFHDEAYLAAGAGDPDAPGQILPGPGWDVRARELFGAAAHFSRWGWADPRASRLLEFWAGVDADVRFILCYAGVRRCLAGLSPEGDPDGGWRCDAVSAWNDKNLELLTFCKKYRSRCCLVDVDAALMAPGRFVEAVCHRFGLDGIRGGVVAACPQAAAGLVERLVDMADLPGESVGKGGADEARALEAVRGELSRLAARVADLEAALGQAEAAAREGESLVALLHMTQERLERACLESATEGGGETPQRSDGGLPRPKRGLWGAFLEWRRERRRLRRLAEIIRESGLFDEDWYLERNPGVAATRMDPILHYLREGAAQGLDPSPEFATTYYLAHNPDVAEASLNPFVHYIIYGREENRQPRG